MNFHNTLNQALEAGGVDLAAWPLGFNLSYGETGRVVTSGTFVTVHRTDYGMYETAISYPSKCEDFQQIHREYNSK
jgi:hypothetical protein